MTQSDAIAVFDSIFVNWPKPEGEQRAKAMTVSMLMTESVTESDLRKAASNYLFFTDPLYCKQFNYWIEDDWRNWVDLNDAQKKVMTASLVFLSKWKKIMKDWWPNIENERRCQRLFCASCYSDYFRDNWKRGLEALDMMNEKPKFACMTISWFCDRGKCTLEKILESNYDERSKESYRYASIERSKIPDISSSERKEAFTFLQSFNID